MISSKFPEPIPVKETTSGAVPEVGEAASLLCEFVDAVIVIIMMPRVTGANFNKYRPKVPPRTLRVRLSKPMTTVNVTDFRG
jgi:hypothetical protein